MRKTMILAVFVLAGISQPPVRAVDNERLKSLADLPRESIEVSLRFNSTHGIYLSWNQPDEAAEIARLGKDLRGDAGDAEKLYRLGELHHAINQEEQSKDCYRKAILYFTQRIQAQPNDGWLRAQYAHAWYDLAEKNQQAEAEAPLRQAVQLAPQDWRCWAALGKFLHQQACGVVTDGEKPAAAANATPAPPASNLEPMLGESSRCFDQAVAVAPQEPQAFEARALGMLNLAVVRCLVRRQQGESVNIFAEILTPNVMADLYQVARLKPTDCQAIVRAVMVEELAMTLKLTESQQQADNLWLFLPEATQQAFLRGREQLTSMTQNPEPKLAAEVWESLGILQNFIWRDRELAKTSLRRAIALDPTRTLSWTLLFRVLVKEAQQEPLVQFCQERLRHHASVLNYLNLAFVYEEFKQFGAAQEQVQAALQLEPQNGQANLAEAVMLLKYGGDADSLTQANEHLGRVSKTLQEAATVEQAVEYTLLRGIHLGLTGNLFEARLRLKEILSKNPDHAAAQSALAALDH